MAAIEIGDAEPTADQSLQFTYDAYADLLDGLRERGFEFVSYGGPVEDGAVLLRHDVDWSPSRALRMAELEADRGVTATYFFLLASPLYNAFFRETREAVE